MAKGVRCTPSAPGCRFEKDCAAAARETKTCACADQAAITTCSTSQCRRFRCISSSTKVSELIFVVSVPGVLRTASMRLLLSCRPKRAVGSEEPSSLLQLIARKARKLSSVQALVMRAVIILSVAAFTAHQVDVAQGPLGSVSAPSENTLPTCTDALTRLMTAAYLAARHGLYLILPCPLSVDRCVTTLEAFSACSVGYLSFGPI